MTCASSASAHDKIDQARAQAELAQVVAQLKLIEKIRKTRA